MTSSAPKGRTQLELPIPRDRVPDRNWERGGRSFYFFDLDDNVLLLPTQIYIFETATRREVPLSTGEFAKINQALGQAGPYQRFEIDFDDFAGSFRRFRDLPQEHPSSDRQPFQEDIAQALDGPDIDWRGPSWDLFFHAVHNGRPVSIITARGHHPITLKRGLQQLYNAGHLSAVPDYLSVFPVTHSEVRSSLGDAEKSMTVPELKMAAIIHSVQTAMARYGENPHHRFGMSDDAPDNVELVVAAMTKLKRRYPYNAFFVIDSSRTPLVKTEVFADHTAESELSDTEQMELFGQLR